jgi:phage baseplate assembly protein V
MLSLDAIERTVKRLIAPIHRRARLTVARAVINLIDDAKNMQVANVSLLDGQVRDEVENFQPLGLTSVPGEGAEGVALSVGGNQDHTVLVGVTDRSVRPTGLTEGETKLYSAHDASVYLNSTGHIIVEDANGSTVVLSADGTITVNGDKITLDATTVEALATTVNLGEATPASAVSLATKADARHSSMELAVQAFVIVFNALVVLYNAHTHTSTAEFKAGTPGVDPFVVTGAPSGGVAGPAIPPVAGSSTGAAKVNAT